MSGFICFSSITVGVFFFYHKCWSLCFSANLIKTNLMNDQLMCNCWSLCFRIHLGALFLERSNSHCFLLLYNIYPNLYVYCFITIAYHIYPNFYVYCFIYIVLFNLHFFAFVKYMVMFICSAY